MRRDIAIGFCFGLALGIACSLLAAGGHGFYFPVAIVSAPAGAIAGIPGALFGAPIIWGLLAAFVRRPAGLLLLLIHCLSIPFVFFAQPDFSDLSRFDLAPTGMQAFAVLTLAMYGLGQIWLWRAALKR